MCPASNAALGKQTASPPSDVACCRPTPASHAHGHMDLRGSLHGPTLNGRIVVRKAAAGWGRQQKRLANPCGRPGQPWEGARSPPLGHNRRPSVALEGLPGEASNPYEDWTVPRRGANVRKSSRQGGSALPQAPWRLIYRGALSRSLVNC